MPPRRAPWRVSAPVLLAAALTAALPAQHSGAEPPAAPALGPVVPPGAPRGTAVDLTLAGTNLAEPLALMASFPARTALRTDGGHDKDSTTARVRVEVPADAPAGWHRVRLATAHGLSNARPFPIDALPQLPEAADNHSVAAAQPVPVPTVVVGRADPELSDYFKFTAAAKQRLSFEAFGRRLGSPLDPVIRLYDARTGRSIPGAWADDTPGLQGDACLTYTFPEAGDYVVEVRDSTHKGGAEAWYRLRVGDFPCALATLPAAAKRGDRVTVRFAGPSAEDAAPVEVQAPADPAAEAVSVTPVGPAGVPGWPVPLLVSDHDELLAPPSVQTMAEAQRLPVPCGVTGRFLRRSQKDHFVFGAKKGQVVAAAAQTADIGSPADVLLAVQDGAGKVLARSRPEGAARIDFTAPADGDYWVVAEHLNYAFGPSEFYRLTVAPAAPEFDLDLTTDRLDVPQGQVALLPIPLLARRDYGGPIEVTVVGPKGLDGSATVPPGVQALPPPPAPQGQPAPPPTPPAALLPVRAAADLAPGAYEVRIRAKGVIDGKDVVAYASTRPAVSAAMNNLPRPPREWLRSVAVGVLPRPPFTLAARFERPEAARGLAAKLIVTAARDAGFDGEIALAARDLPANVTAAEGTIAKGQAEAALELKVQEGAALGSFPFLVVGRASHGDRATTATVLPPPLVVAPPFDLRVEPNPLTLAAGQAGKLKVTAARKGGYDGPVALAFRNLPANVTAPKAAIPAGQDVAEVELTAAANAPVGARGDVSVLGTAAVANQSAASPNFTVRIQPPPPAALALKADPAAVTVKAGATAKLKVTVERQNLAGPVALTVENLPPKLTAAPATVPADQGEAEVELSAAADAAPGKAEVTIKGLTGMVTGAVKVTVQVEK
jgi:hypothetical protein